MQVINREVFRWVFMMVFLGMAAMSLVIVTYLPRWAFWNTVRTLACGLSAAVLLFALLWLTQSQARAA